MNVPVRLNERNIESDMNSDCKKTSYDSAPLESNAQVSHFTNKTCETSHPIKSLDASSGNNLSHDHSNYGESGLLNGCSEFLHNDLYSLHISVNGVDKCGDSCPGELNHISYDRLSENATAAKTDFSNLDNGKTFISPECSVPIPDDFGSVSDCSANDEKSVASSLPLESTTADESDSIIYLGYDSENQMPDIIRLIQKDLSEPYSIYTYRYFIHNWPKLCFLALHRDKCVGAIVCKLDVHKKQSRRGYIAMLAVDEKYRKRKIGSNLVLKAIDAMVEDEAHEVVLETEITNKPALKLYENLGFVRDKRLFRYYLNGVDALRLKLWLR